MTTNESTYQFARCLKDGKLYVFDKTEHLEVTEDYHLIRCLPIDETGAFCMKEILIYWKDLIQIKQ
jgi:hypothetical protein